MDFYDAALRRLKADDRSPGKLGREMKLPMETVRDIKNGVNKDPRLSTLKKITAFYFPKAVSA